MIYKNSKNLDLQKVAIIMDENNIKYTLEKYKIIIKSNSIENHISFNQNEFNFITATPFLLLGLFWVIGLVFFFFLVVLIRPFDEIDTNARMWLGGFGVLFATATQRLAPLFYKIFSSKAIAEKKRILGLMFNYKES